jgi:hypothetical protein
LVAIDEVSGYRLEMSNWLGTWHARSRLTAENGNPDGKNRPYFLASGENPAI